MGSAVESQQLLRRSAAWQPERRPRVGWRSALKRRALPRQVVWLPVALQRVAPWWPVLLRPVVLRPVVLRRPMLLRWAVLLPAAWRRFVSRWAWPQQVAQMLVRGSEARWPGRARWPALGFLPLRRPVSPWLKPAHWTSQWRMASAARISVRVPTQAPDVVCYVRAPSCSRSRDRGSQRWHSRRWVSEAARARSRAGAAPDR